MPSPLHTIGHKVNAYFSINLTRRVSFLFISVLTAIVLIDSTIVELSTYSQLQSQVSSNVLIFVIFSAIFGITGIMLFNSVRKNSPAFISKKLLDLRYSHVIILATQILTISVLLIIIIQMISLNKYNIISLHVVTYVSHLSALFFIVTLGCLFVRWAKSIKTYVIILYAIGFSLVAANIVVSLVYIEWYFSISFAKEIKPYPIHSYVIRFVAYPWSETLTVIFDVLSLSSFLAMWIATMSMVNQYRFKLGNIKFFVLTGIPLIYYLFPFETYFGNIFSPIILNSPIAFGVVYTLIFSATKQVGALLFSLAFLTASSIVSNERVRQSMLISAIGMAILFGSIELLPLPYKIFPPYGLITEASMPLGSYLLFIGIFSSAMSVSRDSELRKDFYKSAKSQLNLLKMIGVTEMEKQLEKKFKSVEKRSRSLKTTEELLEEPEPEDVKEILRDVLNELYSKGKEEKNE